MPSFSRLIASFAFLCILNGGDASAQEKQDSIVLSATPKMVVWADVYKILPDRPDDPYVHVRVFERQKDWEPWRFNELVFHMAVTPEALEASRVDADAEIHSYKDVEIRGNYRRWLDDHATRSKVPVCATDILSCIRQLPPK